MTRICADKNRFPVRMSDATLGKNPRQSAWSASSAFPLTLHVVTILRRYNLYPYFDIIPYQLPIQTP
ncbi:MAG: hypothetical protein LH618_00090 [Saprospiraceae bacterium]|nr:hypothetical protein [Saprospiraceae bacterium]